jgi:6-phosphogluconolactonase
MPPTDPAARASGSPHRRGTLRVVADPPALARAAAQEFANRTRTAVAAAGRFAVVLSGGDTPRLLFRELATSTYRSLPWADVHLFWGDERTVPPEHPDSNYRTAEEELISHVPMPVSNIHRLRGEDPSPERAAADYERELRSFFALAPGELPRFDLVFLGLGGDGHTASLFPRTTALDERARLVVANRVDSLATWRLTLTLPVLDHAACVVFLVSGKGKAEILGRVLDGPDDPPAFPAQMVRPHPGELLWLVDTAAATGLRSRTS